MSFFETFNMDILIVLVALAILGIGLYNGFFKQLKSTLKLVIPFVAIYFLVPLIITSLNNIEIYTNVTSKLFDFLKATNYANTFQIIFYSVLVFLLVYLLTSLVLKLFKKSKSKIPSLSINKVLLFISRFLGLCLSTINCYIVIISLTYIMSIFAPVRHDGVVSKLIYEINNEYFEISELNNYQNAIPSNYEYLNESLDLISGQKLNNDYSFLKNKYNKLKEINDGIPQIYDLLSDEAKALMEKTDIYSLIKQNENGEIVYKLIIDIEAENENIEKIKENFDFVSNNIPYIEMFFGEESLNQDLGVNQYIEEAISYDEAISSLFATQETKNRWKEISTDYIFYKTYGKDIYSLFSDDEYIEDIMNYAYEMYLVFSDQEKMVDFANKFINKYQNLFNPFQDDYYTFKVLVNYFTLLTTNNENFKSLNENISLAGRLIILENYNDLTIDHKWESIFSVKLYVNDSLKGTEVSGHDFYTEYFLYEYILKDVTYNEEAKLDSNDFALMITKIEEYENSGLLENYAAKNFAVNVFINGKGLSTLDGKNYIDSSFVEAIKNSTHSYFEQDLE